MVTRAAVHSAQCELRGGQQDRSSAAKLQFTARYAPLVTKQEGWYSLKEVSRVREPQSIDFVDHVRYQVID